MARGLFAYSLGSGVSFHEEAERWHGGFRRLTWHLGHLPYGKLDVEYFAEIIDVSSAPDPMAMIKPPPEFIDGSISMKAQLTERVYLGDPNDPWTHTASLTREFVFGHPPVPIDEIDKYPLPSARENKNEHWVCVGSSQEF